MSRTAICTSVTLVAPFGSLYTLSTMAAKLGGAFLVHAMGPVRQSAACMQASKMPQGLEEITPGPLGGALRLGIQQVAQRAGVKPADVERVLPMDALAERMEHLKRSHPAALDAWRAHAGQLGGMLKGVADLTVDGRAVLPSAALARIARKVRRDKALAGPVQALSDDMLAWEELLEACNQALEAGADLRQAYRIRVARNALFALGLLVALLAVATEVTFVWAGRRRIDAVLAGKDVCEVEGIAPADRVRGKPEQLAEIAARRASCASQRAWVAFLSAEEARLVETAKETARAQEDLDQRCEALTARAAAGKGTADDITLAGERKALLGRIRMKMLAAKDLGPKLAELPCAATRAEPKMREAFLAAAVASIWNWIGAIEPSDETMAFLRPRADDMSERARIVLAARADELAKRAIRRPTADRISRAIRVCALAATLGVPGKEPCEEAKTLTPDKKP
ncbi:hypothetical protein [Chondromyces apiculatus]|uniref:hypothetical protein n=1 Tax=Chondromyces apiculatus TaxID=51 RepID=UPI0005C6021F|nr:hypothetical protein [Chondromyces apiculatus]